MLLQRDKFELDTENGQELSRLAFEIIDMLPLPAPRKIEVHGRGHAHEIMKGNDQPRPPSSEKMKLAYYQPWLISY